MGSYAGNELVLVNDWIEARLATRATQLEAISTGLSGRIYYQVAPETAAFPHIVYQCQSPPRDVRGVGLSTVMVDTIYIVKATAQTASYETLGPIAKEINVAMSSETGSSVGDGAVFTSSRNSVFAQRDPGSGVPVLHLGGEYHIQAQG